MKRMSIRGVMFIGYSPTTSSGSYTQWLRWHAGTSYFYSTGWDLSPELPLSGVQGKVPVTVVCRAESFTLTWTLKCKRTDKLLEEWQLSTYNAIKLAYEGLLSEYNIAIAEAKMKMNEELLSKNPIHNRTIEQIELRKHAVRLLSRCSFTPSKAMKTDYPGDGVDYPDIQCCEAHNDGKVVQFIENCFQFGLMSYSFYPYYYHNKENWKTIYKLEDADPVFNQFLQAGFARVVVPVRPGYEEAAMRFTLDGAIYNGGDVPGLEDPYYVSIIEELEAPIGDVEGDPWHIRIPTSLTILQNDASGIDESGLPCDEEGLG